MRILKIIDSPHDILVQYVSKNGDGNFIPRKQTIDVVSALVVKLKWKKIHRIEINGMNYDIYNLNNVYMVGVFAYTDINKEIFEMFLRISDDAIYVGDHELYTPVCEYVDTRIKIKG